MTVTSTDFPAATVIELSRCQHEDSGIFILRELPRAEFQLGPVFDNRIGKGGRSQDTVSCFLQCVHCDGLPVSQFQHCTLFSSVHHAEGPIVDEMISVVPRDVVNANLNGCMSGIPHLHNARSLLRNWG